jgi:hypothetical protein
VTYMQTEKFEVWSSGMCFLPWSILNIMSSSLLPLFRKISEDISGVRECSLYL